MFSLTFHTLLDGTHSEYAAHLTIVLAVIGWTLRSAYLMIDKRPGATRLRGPSGGFFGAEKIFFESYSGNVHEAWYKEYGPVYEIPMALGQRKIVLGDPKAIAHFFGKNSWTYTLAQATKVTLARTVGDL